MACGGRGSCRGVFCLLLAGADKEKASNSGKTPLLAACECSGGLRAAYALMSCGADVGKTDQQGQTAWQIACSRDDADDFENVFAGRQTPTAVMVGRGMQDWA